ncbi:SpoIID/LytB domain-containing protein [Georgenia sp. Z1344]|uniref:SpoIID/LytB domain-containing protein n=1 Tax=Georgenia sp. Z1344 TaxID=3416706 RepID=UPI003CEA0BE9
MSFPRPRLATLWLALATAGAALVAPSAAVASPLGPVGTDSPDDDGSPGAAASSSDGVSSSPDGTTTPDGIGSPDGIGAPDAGALPEGSTDASSEATTDDGTTATEVYPRPADGTWEIEGHGWGHGIGMSQWGAQGAALQGVSSTDILSFYYPGTRQADIGNPVVRIRLLALAGRTSVTAWAPSGQTLRATAGGTNLGAPAGGRLTVTRTSTGFRLEHRTTPGGSVGWSTTTTAPVTLATNDGVVVGASPTGGGTWYRGEAAVQPTSGTLEVVNHVRMEDYLRSVVPREAPASWHYSALEAQSVAARTYARHEMRTGGIYDLCDTTSCQVYAGRGSVSASGALTGHEHARTDIAIASTNGRILEGRTTAGGAWGPAFTQFSSSNGGYSVAGSRPYLMARADPWSGTAPGDPVTSWSTTLRATDVDARCAAGGTVRSLVVTARDGRGDLGGRITGLRLDCTTGPVDVTTEFTRRLGMRSSWWRPVPEEYPSVFFLNDAWTAWANHEVRLGAATSSPLAGDWDGDGTDTVGVRDGNRLTLARDHSGATTTTLDYGRAGDVLLTGDWDGDAGDSFAVRRGNTYLLRDALTSGVADTVLDYGRAADEVFVGDWDGDGVDTLAVRRGNRFFVSNSLVSGWADAELDYGRAGDTVLVGDWDGDGVDTFAVRRGNTYLVRNELTSGDADIELAFGRASDSVVVGDWDGDGEDTLGVHRVEAW